MAVDIKAQMRNKKWDVVKRLEFIDFLLFWRGSLNRGDLSARFRISLPQATADLKQYQTLAPKNMVYDSSAKIFYATDTFQTIIYEPSAENLLNELRYLNQETSDFHFLGSTPEVATLTFPRRQISVEYLRVLFNCIQNHQSVEIQYQSLTRITPKWRRIAPHAFGTDGFRWHIRAYCFRTNSFRDFVLGRILDVRLPQPEEVNFSEDEWWHTWVNVMIGPHPGLTADQQTIISRDYGMDQGKLVIPVRRSMLLYLLVLLRVDDEQIEKWRNPEEQQIILLNREELTEMMPA
ncbi:MAG: WYL domain-containing protein [SAR324 cluster bacterium]|nr:WYL domain-containing protein [SAR324 cluster bacterium]